MAMNIDDQEKAHCCEECARKQMAPRWGLWTGVGVSIVALGIGSWVDGQRRKSCTAEGPLTERGE
jgi:hypothetical protein